MVRPNFHILDGTMPKLDLDHAWSIPAKDLKFRYSRSGGPGGQNVNKVATKAELRFAFRDCDALTSGQKQRLARKYPGHVTDGGDFVVSSDSHRSRKLNELDAVQRLRSMLREIRQSPKRRVPTKISRAAKQRRLEQKRRHAAQKRLRGRQEVE